MKDKDDKDEFAAMVKKGGNYIKSLHKEITRLNKYIEELHKEIDRFTPVINQPPVIDDKSMGILKENKVLSAKFLHEDKYDTIKFIIKHWESGAEVILNQTHSFLCADKYNRHFMMHETIELLFRELEKLLKNKD